MLVVSIDQVNRRAIDYSSYSRGKDILNMCKCVGEFPSTQDMVKAINVCEFLEVLID